MFDKNLFKNAFRSWVQNNPGATEEEAKEFCSANIPATAIASHYWLVEQSLEWFGWLKKRKTFDEREIVEEEAASAFC